MTTSVLREACLAAAIAAATVPALSDVQPSAPDFSVARRTILEQMTALRLPAVTVAVARNGVILWEEGFGWADQERQTRATATMPFAIASVTKTIAATALMALATKGRVNLDRPANDYLSAKLHSPMWKASDATVRRLATHTAGLTTFDQTCDGDTSRCSVAREIEKFGVLFWPPGERFDYSNLGYGILGDIIAEAAGRPLASVFRDEVFQPLQMSTCSLGTESMTTRGAVQYEPATHRPSPPTNRSGTPGASAARCSAHDLALFGMFHAGARLPAQRRILNPDTIAAMRQPQPDVLNGQQYGFGWWLSERAGYHIVEAQGGNLQATAIVRLIPSEGIVVVLLSNTGMSNGGDMVDGVLAAMLPAFAHGQAIAAEARPADATAVPPAFVADWQGDVRVGGARVALTLSIPASGDLSARIGTEPPTKLMRASVRNQRVRGEMPATVGSDDGFSQPHDLELYLVLRGERLVGAATTRARPGGANGPALPYFVEMHRR